MTKATEAGKEKSSISQEYVDSSSDASDDDSKNQTSDKDDSGSSTAPPESQSNTVSESSSESDEESAGEGSATSESEGSRGTKRASESSKSAAESRKKTKISNPSATVGGKTSLPQTPTGYEPLSIETAHSVSRADTVLSNLKGKQVWHITAPASVPIASIKSLDISAALRGDPILHHKGISYNMMVTPSRDENLLLLNTSSRTYSKAKVDVSRSLLLRESGHESKVENSKDPMDQTGHVVENDAESSIRNVQFFATSEGSSKKAREQPKDLLMRYQPYGGQNTKNKPYKLLNPNEEEGDQETSASTNRLILPVLDDGEGEDALVTPKKSRHTKKTKKNRSSQEQAPNDAMEVDNTPQSMNGTSPAKIRSSQSQPDSSKKRKKERRAKV